MRRPSPHGSCSERFGRSIECMCFIRCPAKLDNGRYLTNKLMRMNWLWLPFMNPIYHIIQMLALHSIWYGLGLVFPFSKIQCARYHRSNQNGIFSTICAHQTCTCTCIICLANNSNNCIQLRLIGQDNERICTYAMLHTRHYIRCINAPIENVVHFNLK